MTKSLLSLSAPGYLSRAALFADVPQGIIPVDLVTIAQTWGCLFRCRYSYIEGKGYKLIHA
jgi:hypothetical protein